MVDYGSDPAWSDVVPIVQLDGGPNALAQIAYSDEYSEAMSYLRALMAANELSDRVLSLTENIIRINPAHYTVWLYRARVLLDQNRDLRSEIEWLNPIALKYLKNYQIWQHRQTIVDKLDDPTGEQEFIRTMLEKDTKNYHVWSYRHWLVKRFNLFNKGELEETERMLDEDIRNNSAWNHRWFVVFSQDDSVWKDPGIVNRETQFAKSKIQLAPQNESAWNYLRGILRNSGTPGSAIMGFVLQFAPIDEPEKIRSSHALDLLADIFRELGHIEDAERALDLLANIYDPIRENYWTYRKDKLVISVDS
ncbi:protein prenylyltransferase [Eremomyces bilateralis CBS 781.70]|uniref:Protein farnesyltransferase/geranylgeranyltransferase type-1 subunit alpha n=1 Tax=Eremomyces bilateralis CBS 781.70 TaxID=1392243 RepID=A0A6G1GBX4_9PEZI|nr:protein prenylyltransferase [Eremomyces bilateralis CBS 781.70]KAF1815401.1 protein prenylyltransferase [Eremomyces bilateralis CBS 781.70]